MAWAPLLSNQWVSCNDLQDAVTTGVFTLKAGQTIPATNQWITRTQAETWINCTVTNGTASQWPQKSWIIPATTTTTTTTTVLGVLSFPFFTFGTNITTCDYSGFPSTVYRDLSDTGRYYTDTSLTTFAPAGWVKRDSSGLAQYITAGGGEGSRMYLLNGSLQSCTLETHVATGSTSSVTSVYNVPRNTSYKFDATITSSNNATIPWKIVVRTATATLVAESAINNDSSVGQTNTITVSNNTCDTLAVSLGTSLPTPAGVDSFIEANMTFTLP